MNSSLPDTLSEYIDTLDEQHIQRSHALATALDARTRVLDDARRAYDDTLRTADPGELDDDTINRGIQLRERIAVLEEHATLADHRLIDALAATQLDTAANLEADEPAAEDALTKWQTKRDKLMAALEAHTGTTWQPDPRNPHTYGDGNGNYNVGSLHAPEWRPCQTRAEADLMAGIRDARKARLDALAAAQQLRDKYTAKPEPAPRIELTRIVDKEVQQ